MTRHNVPLWERIFDKIGVGKPDDCWEWDGALQTAGYGKIFDNELAHRIVYSNVVAPIPEGMLILHHCDNPPCCNPKHLWLGTDKDNMHDASVKGRLKGRGQGPHVKY